MRRSYEDIIDRPAHKSLKHPPMSLHDRAAQFSPFAALSGYEAAVSETARLTESQMNLSEDYRSQLDWQLKPVLETGSGVWATFTYFLRDKRKAGGQYLSVRSLIHKYDEVKRLLYLDNGLVLALDNIVSVVIDD